MGKTSRGRSILLLLLLLGQVDIIVEGFHFKGLVRPAARRPQGPVIASSSRIRRLLLSSSSETLQQEAPTQNADGTYVIIYPCFNPPKGSFKASPECPLHARYEQRKPRPRAPKLPWAKYWNARRSPSSVTPIQGKQVGTSVGSCLSLF